MVKGRMHPRIRSVSQSIIYQVMACDRYQGPEFGLASDSETLSAILFFCFLMFSHCLYTFSVGSGQSSILKSVYTAKTDLISKLLERNRINFSRSQN